MDEMQKREVEAYERIAAALEKFANTFAKLTDKVCDQFDKDNQDDQPEPQ